MHDGSTEFDPERGRRFEGAEGVVGVPFDALDPWLITPDTVESPGDDHTLRSAPPEPDPWIDPVRGLPPLAETPALSGWPPAPPEHLPESMLEPGVVPPPFTGAAVMTSSATSPSARQVPTPSARQAPTPTAPAAPPSGELDDRPWPPDPADSLRRLAEPTGLEAFLIDPAEDSSIVAASTRPTDGGVPDDTGDEGDRSEARDGAELPPDNSVAWILAAASLFAAVISIVLLFVL